jgi:hypothetical protein
MTKAPDFDLAKAHRYFAAYCFNQAWDLIEKEGRTAADDRMMVALSQASIFHWSQRPDCEDRNMSIGYWQASHVQSLIGNPVEAARLGEICLSFSQDLPPFFLAHAHEALARAHVQLGRREDANRHLAAARELLPLVQDQADRDRLVGELGELG